MRKNAKFYRWVALAGIGGLLACQSAFRAGPQSIRLQGSDTMAILSARLAEEYMKYHPNASVYVAGGGTSQGLQALIHGQVDISAASRSIRASEVRLMAQKHGKIGVHTLVAKDALSLYLHPDNPVQDLSLAQIRQVFTGRITNWRELNGPDAPIRVFIRPPSSGTHLYFQEHVLEGENYTEAAVILPTTGAMVRAISENIHAIAYGGIAYGAEIRHCQVNGIAPTKANVRNDSYPITRYLYFYTIDTPRGMVREFIDWVLQDGQKTVQEVGYIPLWELAQE